MGWRRGLIRVLGVKNFGIIEDITIEFSEGFNVLTGETGAGKSLVIDSIQFLLGERTGADIIREGSSSAEVEAIIDTKGKGRILEMLKEAGIEQENETEIVIRRTLEKGGKSRVYVSGRLSTVGFLKRIGEELIEITGQYGGYKFLQPSGVMQIYDLYADTTGIRKEVEDIFSRLSEIESELQKIKEKTMERMRRIDVLKFEIEEINRANLKDENEEAELLKQKEVLLNAEKIIERIETIHNELYSGDDSVISKLKRVERSAEEVVRFIPQIIDEVQKVKDAYYLIDDVSRAIERYKEGVSANPGKLEEVEDRLQIIKSLKRKYGNSINEIILWKKRAEEELSSLESFDEREDILKKEMEVLRDEIKKKGEMLSKKRTISKERLSREIERELKELAMEKSSFRVEFNPVKMGIDIGGKFIGKTGFESIEFEISTNPGFPPRPLREIASGGELSRIILAQKMVLSSKDDVSSVIYDEIDSGVGGGVAEMIGAKLKRASKNH